MGVRASVCIQRIQWIAQVVIYYQIWEQMVLLFVMYPEMSAAAYSVHATYLILVAKSKLHQLNSLLARNSCCFVNQLL